jgi:hypothetical protein
MGTVETVPRAPHIFGSGGVWFGRGPVYVNLAWKGDRLPPARFGLSLIPVEGDARRAKTPWVAEPTFAGTIVIRGRSLSAAATPLRFSFSGDETDRLELQAPHGAPSVAAWSFWATAMYVPGPGCYGVQIDTRDSRDTVVFEATP